MKQAIRAGLRHCLGHWPVVVFLYAALLAPALIFGAVAWARFQAAMDRSLAARTLLRDLDLNVFVDLFAHHPDMGLGISIGAVLIGAATLMAWVWLHAAAVGAAAGEGSLSEAMRRAHDLFSRFMRLWWLTTAINGAVLGAAYVLGRWLLRMAAEAESELTPYVLVGGCAGLALLWLFLSMVVHDHARVRCALEDEPALAAYRWALAYCFRERQGAVSLGVAMVGGGAVLWALYQGVASWIPVRSTPGVILSLSWGQVFALAKAGTRFWYFCAAYCLQAEPPQMAFPSGGPIEAAWTEAGADVDEQRMVK